MLSMSISLIAVFIPILLMGGIVGRLFREFAVMLSGRDPDFDGGFADGDADDVRSAAQGEAQSRAAVPMVRANGSSSGSSPPMRALCRSCCGIPAVTRS